MSENENEQRYQPNQNQMPPMPHHQPMMPHQMQHSPMPYYPQAMHMQQDPMQQMQQMQQMQPMPDHDQMLPIEESYIENILRLNRGKVATVYMTFDSNEEWNAKVFKGIVEEAGRDHIILSDPENNKHYLLLSIYLDYITFDDEIEYDYPFNNQF
ncbi:spore germination protein Q [Pelagirhabdus alkalitolerans]|uniref:Spore germination protein Q n=1 Tax=Pelagirhabdus alkalitolerans TaxID=1612202 RepID=A0A1G6GI54_9BACI|nr:spore coat protein GerQ [Pelagirhabdus alkalitolerans]SDB81688.1 spore germination protein Q [Pelagirhabdus alkalitolerans]